MTSRVSTFHQHIMSNRERSGSSASEESSQRSSQTLRSDGSRAQRTSGDEKKQEVIDKETEDRLRREWTGYAPLPAVKGTMGGIGESWV